MGHLLPQLSHRKAMLFEVQRFARPAPTAAAVLWTMSLDRDPEVLTSLRLKEANLFEQAWRQFDTMPRHLRISVTHGEGRAHLFLFMDGSAFLSRETSPEVHDILPLPLLINSSPNVTILSNGQPWYCPSIKIWAKGVNGAVFAFQEGTSDRKADALEFIDFTSGDDTRTQDPRLQPIIDVLFEDIRRVADIAAEITDPFVSNCAPGSELPGGARNRWSPAVPFSQLSAEEIEDIERRAYLAAVLIYQSRDGEKVRTHSSQYAPPEHRNNNVVHLGFTADTLSSHLIPFGVTEEDFLGYDRERLKGFRYVQTRTKKVLFINRNPEPRYELSIDLTVDNPPTAHEIIEARAALADAQRRKAARLEAQKLLSYSD